MTKYHNEKISRADLGFRLHRQVDVESYSKGSAKDRSNNMNWSPSLSYHVAVHFGVMQGQSIEKMSDCILDDEFKFTISEPKNRRSAINFLRAAPKVLSKKIFPFASLTFMSFDGSYLFVQMAECSSESNQLIMFLFRKPKQDEAYRLIELTQHG